jgi:predicted CoA-substrate-specific enzyme activase
MTAATALDPARLECVAATGYGRRNVDFATMTVTEITCHAKGVHSLLPTARTIIDIGGQDSKGIIIANGKVTDFVMNDKCAAGTGRFLEVIADALHVPLAELGQVSLSADKSATISNICTVFAEHEVVAKLAEGERVANLVAGVHDAIATRVHAMVNKLKIEPDLAMTGGGSKNIGLVRALEARYGGSVLVPPEPLITGALGAALIGREMFERAEMAGQTLARSAAGLQEAKIFS